MKPGASRAISAEKVAGSVSRSGASLRQVGSQRWAGRSLAEIFAT